MEGNCSSCGKRTVNDEGQVSFPCPKCHKNTITRCGHCRKVVAKYSCHECGFEGPN